MPTRSARWAKAAAVRGMTLGCVLEDPVSVRAFQVEMERKKSNVQRVREHHGKAPGTPAGLATGAFGLSGNGEALPPPGRRGAAAALERLEIQEERAHARLEAALVRGNPVEIDAAQTFLATMCGDLAPAGFGDRV